MKNPFFLCVFCLFLSSTGCKKNTVDFNKYDKATLKPNVLTPIGQGIIKATDIFKQDSNLRYSNDGSIRFVFPADTFLSIEADTLLNGVKLGKSFTLFEVGNLEVQPTSVTINHSIEKVNQFNDQPLKGQITNLDGQNARLPGFTSPKAIVDTIPDQTEYELLNLSSGKTYCQLTNNWPNNINKLKIEVLDLKSTTPNLPVMEYEIVNCAPGEIARDSFIFDQTALSNSLVMSITELMIDSTNQNTLIDLTNELNIELSFVNCKASSGRAKIPEQAIPVRSASVDLSQPDSREKLRNIEFGKALIPVSVQSSLNTGADISLLLPDATRNSTNIDPINKFVSKGTSDLDIDLSNCRLNMGADTAQDYNMLRVQFFGTLKASTSVIDFSSTDFFKINYDATNSSFKYADGYLGSDTFEVFLKDLNVSQLSDFLSNLKMENPTMVVNVSNSFGVDSEVELMVTAVSKEGTELDLDIDKINPPFPSIAERGTLKYETFKIDNNNSNFSEGLKLPAQTFNVRARVVFNQNGFIDYTDHLIDTSRLIVSFGAEIPLELSSDNIEYIDTIDIGNNLSQLEGVEEVELTLATENSFPFDASLDLFYATQDFTVIDSQISVQILKSADVDPQGNPLTPAKTKSQILISKAQIEKFKQRAPRYILVRANISTYQNGSVPVRINQNCQIYTALALRAILKQEL